MVENLFKICFFKVSGSIFKLESDILSQNGETENVLTIQGQIGEIYPQSPGKLRVFQFQPYFSTCLCKILPTTPIKVLLRE